jgi:hypothetical protein
LRDNYAHFAFVVELGLGVWMDWDIVVRSSHGVCGFGEYHRV